MHSSIYAVSTHKPIRPWSAHKFTSDDFYDEYDQCKVRSADYIGDARETGEMAFFLKGFLAKYFDVEYTVDGGGSTNGLRFRVERNGILKAKADIASEVAAKCAKLQEAMSDGGKRFGNALNAIRDACDDAFNFHMMLDEGTMDDAEVHDGDRMMGYPQTWQSFVCDLDWVLGDDEFVDLYVYAAQDFHF